jgi:hypothetical protein
MSHSWKLFLCLFLTYAFFANPYLTTNDAPRFCMAAAIVDYGTLEISRSMPEYFPQKPGVEGWAVRDFALVNGKYYSDKAPLGSFLAAPWYFLISRATQSRTVIIWFVTLFTAGLFTALTGVLVYALGRHFLAGDRMAMLMGLGYGLCSMALFYGQIFFSGGITAFFTAAGLLLLLKDRLNLGGRYAPMLAGACLALAIMCEYTAGITSLALLGYAAANRKNFSRVILFFALTLGLLLAYNYYLLGNPFETAYHYSYYSKTLHAKGFYGVSWPGARGLLRLGELLFGFPFSTLLARLGMAPAFDQPAAEKWGFFLTCLPVAFSIIYFGRFMKFRREAVAIAAAFAGYLVLNMSMGWFDAYSARFFMPVLPLLFLPLATLPVYSPGVRNTLFFTLGISFAINLAGADAFMPAVKSLAQAGRQNLLGYWLSGHGRAVSHATLLALGAVYAAIWLAPGRRSNPPQTQAPSEP